MDPVGSDHGVGLEGDPVAEVHNGPGPVFPKVDATVTGGDNVVGELRKDHIEEIGPMHADMVAASTGRNGAQQVGELGTVRVAGHQSGDRRPDAVEGATETEVTEHPDAVRCQHETGTDLGDALSLLKAAHLDTTTMESERGRQAPNPPADNRYAHRTLPAVGGWRRRGEGARGRNVHPSGQPGRLLAEHGLNQIGPVNPRDRLIDQPPADL